jgi:hypothetical protein
VASYLGRNLPTAMNMASRGLNTASQLAANPLVNQAMNRFGVNANTMRQVAGGINNVQAGLNLVPGTVRSVQQGVQGVAAAAAPAAQSLAQLYRTVQGGA